MTELSEDQIIDETPELDPASFDLNAWIGGVTGTIRAVTLYQRSDLLAQVDDLQRQLRVAESVSDEDRGMNDATPDSIRRQLEQVFQEFEASALVFKVQGRSDGHRDRIAQKLKKQGIKDEYEVTLHQVADAVVEPEGVTVEFLRKLGEVSEPQLKMLTTASALANYQPPAVDTAFLSRSSGDRKRPARS